MDSSPRTPSGNATQNTRGTTSTPGGSSTSRRSRDRAGANVMDTSDMSEPLAQPLPASPGPSVTGSGIGGPPSVASSTSMLAPTPGAGEYLMSYCLQKTTEFRILLNLQFKRSY